MNTASVRDPNYQYMYSIDQVLNPSRVGLDLNIQGAQGEFNSHPVAPQSGARSRVEPNFFDFSKSLTQLLNSMGNLNENPREGFAVVSAFTDNWRQTMGSQYTSQEESLLKFTMNTAIQKSLSLNLGIQA